MILSVIAGLASATTYKSTSCTRLLTRTLETELHQAAKRTLPDQIRDNPDAYNLRTTLVNYAEVSDSDALAVMVTDHAVEAPWTRDSKRLRRTVFLKVDQDRVIAALSDFDSIMSQPPIALGTAVLSTRDVLPRRYFGQDVFKFGSASVAAIFDEERADESPEVPYLVHLQLDHVKGVYDKYDPYGQDPKRARIPMILAEFKRQFPEDQLFELVIDDQSPTDLIVRVKCIVPPRFEAHTRYFDVSFYPGGPMKKMEKWFWTDERIPKNY